MDYCDIEWFALETNRDHSVIFEVASKHCISDSFVDHEGYSIASLVAQLVRNSPAVESWVRSLGWEDPLKKGKANLLQYSGLENSLGWQRVGLD